MGSKGHIIVHAIEGETKSVSLYLPPKMHMTNVADCCSKLNNAEAYVWILI